MFNLFTKKSVAGVLAAFNKTLDHLKAVEIHHEQEAARHAETVVIAQADHDASIKEAALSREVQSRLLAVINPPAPQLGGAAALLDHAG